MPDGLLLVDKERDWTSHDVAAKCRSLLHERRVGHGGTLDPMATGLLVIFAGRATRAVPYLPGNKTYTARMRFGIETDTQDITGRVTREHERIPPEGELIAALPRFTGDIEQIPPMVSAVQIGGQRLYKLARQGIEIARPARPVTIESLRLTGCADGEYELEISCSAGTYIRTLIHDLGRALGSGAVMTALRRTRSGPFSVENALPVRDVTEAALMPTDRLFEEYPALTLPPAHEKAARNGCSFPAGEVFLESCMVRVYDAAGSFFMLGRHENGLIHTEKSFFQPNG